MDTQSAFDDLQQIAGNKGWNVVQQVSVTSAASVAVDYPPDASKIGILLKCATTDNSWRAEFGDDNSRWAEGHCPVDLSYISAVFDVNKQDDGQVALSVTASNPQAIFVLVVAY